MRKSSILLIIATIWATQSIAQDDDGLGGKFNVVRDYKPKLQDAEKLNIPAVLEPIRVKPFTFEYQVSPKLFELQPYYREGIQPISLGSFNEEPIPRSEVLFGLGNYQNIWAEAYYGSKKPKNKYYSIALKHRSGKAAVDYSNFSKTKLDLFGKKIYKRHILTANLTGNYISAHRYADFTDSIPDSINFEADSIKNAYMWAGLDLSFGNYKNAKAAVNYQSNLNAYYLGNNNDINEWATLFDTEINKKFKDGNQADFLIQYDYNAYNNIIGTLNRSIVRVNAAYKYFKPKIKVRAGFKTASDNVSPMLTTESSTNDFHIYPDFKIEYEITDKVLTAFGGVDGQLKKNSIVTTALINPFINSIVQLENTNEALRAYAGIRGSYSDELSFELSAQFKTVSNLMLFATNDSLNYMLQPVYSGSNSSIVNLHAEIQYQQKERWMMNFTTNYYSYTLVSIDPLNLPTFDAQLDLRYAFQNKMRFMLNVFAFNSRISNNEARTDKTTLNGAVDLNLGADYILSNKMSVFLNINNILNKKYQIWNRYQVQGLHAIIGVRLNLN